MKKLAALLMVLMLLLCAAAQAESAVVIDLSKIGSEPVLMDKCFAADLGVFIAIRVECDVVITGSTDKPVVVMYRSGEITLRNVDIEAEKPEEDFFPAPIPFGMLIARPNLAPAPEPVALSLMSGEEETKAPLVMNLEGMNRINAGLEEENFGVAVRMPLTLRGSGSLHTSALGVGKLDMPDDSLPYMDDSGDFVVEGGDLVVTNSFEGAYAIATADGSLTVKGGSVIAYSPFGAYPNKDLETGIYAPGKVSAAADYVILAGKNVDTAQIVGEYKGEEYLEITKLVEPEITPSIPETGDGANLVLWTLMLAASVIGVLSMRRKAY